MSVALLVDDLGGDMERGVGGGHASVDRELQQDLLQIAGLQLVRQAGADVQAELFPAAERGRRCQDEQAASDGDRGPAASRCCPRHNGDELWKSRVKGVVRAMARST